MLRKVKWDNRAREQACRDVILHDLWAGFRELVHVCVQWWDLEGMWHDLIKLKRWDLCFNLPLNVTLNKRGEIILINTSSYYRHCDKKVECHSLIKHLNVKRDKLTDPGAATLHRNMTSAGRILLKLTTVKRSVCEICMGVCSCMCLCMCVCSCVSEFPVQKPVLEAVG